MKNKRKYEDGGATTAEATAKKRLKQLQKKMSRNSVLPFPGQIFQLWKNQCCGSVSRLLAVIGSRPRIVMYRNIGKIYSKKNLSECCIFFLRPRWRNPPAPRENSSHPERISSFSKQKVPYFFFFIFCWSLLPFWIRIQSGLTPDLQDWQARHYFQPQNPT